jgi:iron complex outermembrane receptor protein
MVAFILLTLSLPPGFAEEDLLEETEEAFLLDELVVTGSANDVTLLDTPATINIFTADDFKKGGYVDVADVLSGLPGITNDTTNPATPKFNFRGTAYAHSRGATVYVDGRQINIGRIGYGDLSFVDLDDVEQIQVLKTPGSQFSEPSRGVIYITTKKGKQDGHSQHIEATYGSWGLHTENLSASGKSGAYDYRLSVANKGGEGYRRTEDERTSISANGGYAIDEDTRIGLSAGYQDQSYLTAGSLEKWQWDRDARDITPPEAEEDPGYDLSPNENDVEIYDISAEFDLNKERWFAQGLLSFISNDTEYLSQKNKNNPLYADGNDASSYLRDYEEDRVTFKASGGHNYEGDTVRNTLTLGTEYDGHDYSQTRTYVYLDEPDSRRLDYMAQYDLDISIDRVSVYLSDSLDFNEHLNLQTGLRYDNVDLTFENRLEDDPDVENTYRETSWNVSPSYSFSNTNNLYFTVSQSYFYPNIDYTRMSAQKNDDYPENDPGNLKPEDILTYEVGFKHQFSNALNYSIAFFHMTVDDKFIFQYRYDEEEEEWDSLGACNLGRAVHQGIEIEVDGQPAEWFSYRFNYGYLDAKWDDADATYSSYVWEDDPADDYREGMSIDGNTVARTPEHKIGASVSLYPTESITAWMNLTYVSDQYTDYMERVVQPSVTTLDFKLSYSVPEERLKSFGARGLTIHGLIKNLTNEKYAYYSNTTGARNDDGTLDISYYPYPGRYFEIGLSMDFQTGGCHDKIQKHHYHRGRTADPVPCGQRTCPLHVAQRERLHPLGKVHRQIHHWMGPSFLQSSGGHPCGGGPAGRDISHRSVGRTNRRRSAKRVPVRIRKETRHGNIPCHRQTQGGIFNQNHRRLQTAVPERPRKCHPLPVHRHVRQGHHQCGPQFRSRRN